MKKFVISSLLLFTNLFLYAQDKKEVEGDIGESVPVEQDTIVNFIVDYEEATAIDSVWASKLYNSKLYPQLSLSIRQIDHLDEESIIKEVSTELLKQRLEDLNAKTPFVIEYNPTLESVINFYLKRNRKAVENLMALSHYYFPMFEEKLDKYDIPLEMKYLAIVESALNPRAKSRVGATGLWQFMYATGKMHGLDVTSYYDERMDPVLSTEAACKYLKNLYDTFQDWDLALASYNSGPGNVAKAIRRSGGNTNYWELRNYLPRETAGYVPSFIATMYMFEYADEHGFKPYQPEITYFETDTIKVKGQIKFDQIEKTTGVNRELLSFLNPSYKLEIVPYIENENHYIRLPKAEAGVFVSNESVIYDYAKKLLAQEEAEAEAKKALDEPQKTYYRVRRGDYLGKIADRFGVSISSIKQWNGLRSSRLNIGQKLTIYSKNGSDIAENTERQEVYTVKPGDTLWSISKKYPGVSVQNIQNWNGISGKNIKPGMKLKVTNG
ncbi:LysM peptidoglycan-binding domain-containing protein [Mesonia sp. K7]|uniref:LysM peptidoglycan-binding domain-containing protein n=1 Tax=Mesonia sp. K7 TaxID=2218606 RepID=UPI000DAA23D4|nr:LysM peptidoglycan-binding domain-containing protein [Mesonia sp. K7]PZD79123.1 lytic transglycosylase [Mesonia sp. K7]